MKHANRRVGSVLAGAAIAAVVLIGCARRGLVAETVVADQAKPQAIGEAVALTNPLDPQRAYGYLQEICALGPRMSGSPGMKKQQALVQAHFEKLGGKVSYQQFLANNPLGGEKVRMANMLIEWHPERKERILLVAHYDTRPLPDQDLDPTKRRSGTFIGANDGGSGVALLMELAHLMPKLEGPIGVDFLLVDGEELVYVDQRDPYCLGSAWFAKQYVEKPPGHKYRWGVVLDMIGDADLQVYQEKFSITWRETRPMVKDIWATAGRLGVKEFIPRVGYEVKDDHIPLRNSANIPTCDIIDFTYPAWHTTNDTPQRCAGSSLAKVGWVVYEWLKAQETAKPVAAGK
jgi:glutaminyl-peptide cyclotransferase